MKLTNSHSTQITLPSLLRSCLGAQGLCFPSFQSHLNVQDCTVVFFSEFSNYPKLHLGGIQTTLEQCPRWAVRGEIDGCWNEILTGPRGRRAGGALAMWSVGSPRWRDEALVYLAKRSQRLTDKLQLWAPSPSCYFLALGNALFAHPFSPVSPPQDEFFPRVRDGQ